MLKYRKSVYYTNYIYEKLLYRIVKENKLQL